MKKSIWIKIEDPRKEMVEEQKRRDLERKKNRKEKEEGKRSWA